LSFAITYKCICNKCGYNTIKTIGDTDIEILYLQCPKCCNYMQKIPIDRRVNIFGTFFNRFFMKK